MGWMHFIEKFDRENIDGQHLRPPVLAILLETIERKDCSMLPHTKIVLYGISQYTH